ncbi:MAG: limonene-1,2-epoxide hydrolase [Reinekea sp.]|jgi:limonene-1,2-epoxide hydrolase
MTNIIERIQETYAALNKDTVESDLLANLYADNVVFIDPLHRIETLPNLQAYFKNMYQNVSHINFDFTHTLGDDKSAFLAWDMTFVHPKLNGGRAIVVPGTSRVQFADGKITHHQDYFDSTAMLFGHIPLLKQMINLIKNRLN